MTDDGDILTLGGLDTAVDRPSRLSHWDRANVLEVSTGSGAHREENVKSYCGYQLQVGVVAPGEGIHPSFLSLSQPILQRLRCDQSQGVGCPFVSYVCLV